MKRFSLALVIIACCVSVFYGQAATFKTKQKKLGNSGKKAAESKAAQSSIVRNTDLNVISAIKGGDVFIGGRGTSFEGEKIRGYGLLVKISNGEIVFKKLPFLSDIRDIFFVDNTTGWITGYGGTYKTIDGGETWEKAEFSGVNGSLFFLDAANGWYFSDNAVLKRVKENRVEALKSFENFPYVRKLQFTSSERGWLRDVVKGQGRFLQTKDGGKNWNAANIDGDNIDDFQFINDYQGFVLARDGLYYTNDGGEIWQPIKKETKDEWFNKLFFENRNTGWIIGQKNCFTQNAGITWKCADSLKELKDKSIRDFVFTDDRNGWLLTDKGLYFTENSGTVWQRKPLLFEDISF
ncbi:MAG TPA: YCF48-related protein [Pyrinomonadaceae bacterium]|nr:YCF48-related protein [Pyrinomonadaceae bacterium]